MIQLTRINHTPLIVNSDLIEHIENTPDTILSLTNGQKLVVLEPVEEIIQRIIQFRRTILAGPVTRETPKETSKEAAKENLKQEAGQ